MVTVRCSGHIIIINCVVVVPHRCTRHKLRPIATYVAWSVCLSVCLSVLAVNVCGSCAHGGAAFRWTTVTAGCSCYRCCCCCLWNKALVSLAQLTNVSPYRPLSANKAEEICVILSRRPLSVYFRFRTAHRERKCADTIGTVLVRWAGHFQW